MDPRKVPKYHQSQVVYLALLNAKGQPKNDLARKCAHLFAQTGTLERCQWFPRGQRLVYTVKLDHGELVQVTEDCLIPANNYHVGHSIGDRLGWHR